MKLYNFYAAYNELMTSYGIELTPDTFEEMGMNAWERIGNRMMTTKSVKLDIVDGIVTLPCDVDELEAITADNVEFKKSDTSKDHWAMHQEYYTEQYIERTKGDRDHLYTSGEFIKYDQIDTNTIKVYRKSGKVNVLYKTTTLDENELPMINSKEVNAIAAYCAYADTFKKGLMTRDGNMINLSQALEQKWLKLCDHARTPINMSQNDFDAIGDVSRSWDRKTYGHSYKPIR